MKNLKSLSLVIILIFSALANNASYAQTIHVPEPLEPWVDWVLQDNDQIDCPYLNNSYDKICAWPSRLKLDLNDQGGQFSQEWELYSETLVRLPGGEDYWPLNVKNGDVDVLIQSDEDTAFARLPKGKHTITGEFKWGALPESLYITPASGLVDLTVNKKKVARPIFDGQGQLWLTQSETKSVSQDNIEMDVFRRVVDGHPVQVETLIKLRVSGKQRNADLGSVLLEGLIATSINSRLPARIEDTDQLKIQLRPGEWSIRIVGRAPADILQFTMPKLNEPWPTQEVWVFQSDNNMRQVQVTDVTSIDPSQTRLPDDWKNLPAYLLTANQTLKLDVKERGITNLERDELELRREMWLDFDGSGFSIKDQIAGTIQQSRINVLPEIELGKVTINKQPQFITRETGNDAAGVEVRQKNINLNAESRYNGTHAFLPANGWNLDLQKVSTTLHLPPGWQVLAVMGTDNLPNTWIEKWSLLDLFLVIIIIMSIRHFYGWSWAGLALFALVLTWHEKGAPHFIWLNLLAVTALLAVLHKHKIANWLERYRWITLATLAVILLGYMIDTIRISIYPQLDRSYTQSSAYSNGRYQKAQTINDFSEHDIGEIPSLSIGEAMESEQTEEIVVTGTRATVQSSIDQKRISTSIVDGLSSYSSSKSKVDLQQIDPNSMIQSGPGLPSWSGSRKVQLSWAGPVKAEQTSRLILLSPTVNLVVRLFGIALLLGLTFCFIQGRVRDFDKGDGEDNDRQSGKTVSPADWIKWLKPSTAALVVCFILPMAIPELTQAQNFPDYELLEELEERLTQPPECLTETESCAQIEQMAVNVSQGTMELRLRVHALTTVAIPLPTSQDTWLPSQVLLNGKPATAIARGSDESFLLSLSKGHHDVVLIGPMPKLTSFPLSLQLNPRFSSWSSDDNSWAIEGINQDGVTNFQLQLTRVVSDEDEETFESDQSSLPSFFKVSRQLQFGLDWYVQTTVTRIAPLGVPLNVSIPLLENEQLLDEQLNVENGKVTLSFSATQSRLSWSSKLNTSTGIELTAANNPNYLEVWSVDASPIWRVETQGLPVNKYTNSIDKQAGGQHKAIPVWQPWPGETLRLTIDRPEGAPGQAVTILQSNVTVSAGKRLNDVTLNLRIRSSRGIQHQITLPDNTDVQELDIGNAKQRVQMDDNILSFTLKPGEQNVTVKWQDANAQKVNYQFPKIDLQLPSVNASASVQFPRDRWVLWANGPLLGPAVLFWGVLLALLVLAIGLGWSKKTPLNIWQWFLLSIGLSQTTPALIMIVVACFFGLSLRSKLTKQLTRFQFNTMQLSLIALCFVSLLIMVVAVANGLLGNPDMQIAGNGSSRYFLKWYQDRVSGLLPQPDIISVPIWVYRVLMLMWAMWLAMSLLKWIKWGWQSLSTGEFWQKAPKKEELEASNEKPVDDN